MKTKILSKIFITISICAAALLASTIVWPQIDLIVSGWFYVPGQGFVFAKQPLFLLPEKLAYYGSRGLGIFFLLAVLAAHFGKKLFLGLDTKRWLFLFLGLLLGPCLITNVVFKDHWGRARPRETVEFGGKAAFSPALVPQKNAHRNGSFLSGDASFGFFLSSIAYVVPSSRSRRVFWSGIGAGTIFGAARIILGAHFLSDVLFAVLVTLSALAVLHAAMFGREATRRCWQRWIFADN